MSLGDGDRWRTQREGRGRGRVWKAERRGDTMWTNTNKKINHRKEQMRRKGKWGPTQKKYTWKEKLNQLIVFTQRR